MGVRAREAGTVVPAAAPTRMADDERDAVRRAMAEVVADGPWIGGPAVERFETEFAAASGCAFVVGVANGTDALTLAMQALELPIGSGVLVPANDGGYAALPARSAGLRPIPLDSDDRSGVGVAQAEAAMSDEVSALVVTHLHGDPVPLAELDAWRRARGIRLIEDCAQAHGAAIGSTRVGTTGDAAAYSFYPTKNLGAIGDAGAIATDDADTAERVRVLSFYGWRERYRIDAAGGRNSRMDPLQAAVLSARLPWLAARNERRRDIAQRYRNAIAGGGLGMLGDPHDTVAHHAVVLSDRREELIRFLESRGVTTAIHYPALIDEMPGLKIPPAPLESARRLREQVLSIPCFPEMREHEVKQVVGALRDWGHRA